MNVWSQINLFAFLGGAVAVLLLTPLFQLIAEKTGFLDCPQANHKGHRQPTPLLGGAAMFTGWILCIGWSFSVGRTTSVFRSFGYVKPLCRSFR